MAIGDTDVAICNKALLFLGANKITSFSEASASADACNLLYNEIKKSTLAMYSWSFSLGKATLARETTTPVSEWLIKNWEIGQSSVGGTVLFSDEETITIDYQKDVDEGAMPSYFVQLLAYQLAWHLAETITDQTGKVDVWRNIALGNPGEGMRGGYFRQAVSIDSAGQTPGVISDYMLTEIR